MEFSTPHSIATDNGATCTWPTEPITRFIVGLMTWFTALTVVVRFIPHRIDPNFFRLIKAILGLIVLGFATFCIIVLFRHFPH